MGKPESDWTKDPESQATQKKVFIGKVRNYYKNVGAAEVVLRGKIKLKIGDAILIQGPTTGSVEEKITYIEKNHKPIKEAKGGDKIAIKINSLVRENDEVYIVRLAKV